MNPFSRLSPPERLLRHVQKLELLELEKAEAADNLKDAFKDAKSDGYDTVTLKVVLKLRKMTPEQRRERKALEAIYLAALGMLEGDPLTDEARRRLDGDPPTSPEEPRESEAEEQPTLPEATDEPQASPAKPQQPALALKDPEEARQEGAAAAEAGKRIYDNPFPAGDPCRAAWDEGWCAHKKSHGMDTPAAYQRRTNKTEKPAAPSTHDTAATIPPAPGNGSDRSGADEAQAGA